MYVPSRNNACQILSLGNLQSERGAEPLHEVHSARVGARRSQRIVVGAVLEPALLPCVASVRGRDRATERPCDGPAQIRIARHSEPQCRRHGEDPLPDRNEQKHAADEIRREFGHSASAARGKERAALAREGDETIGRAMGAVDAAEAVRGVAAREEAAQLVLDVARQAPAAVLVLEPGEERLQVLADERVQGRRRRVAA